MKISMRTKKRKQTKRTKPTRIGSRFIIIAAVLVCSAFAAFGAKKDKPENAPAYALIAGTVYRPPGFALPGVKVVVEPEQAESHGAKLKKTEAVTDSRGEWAVRVPPVPAKWRIDVKVNGYRPEQRSVSVEGEQRVDSSIVLEPTRPSKEATQ
jgi:hypothetical protein